MRDSPDHPLDNLLPREAVLRALGLAEPNDAPDRDEETIRAALDLPRRWSYLYQLPDGQLGELDTVVTTAGAWAAAPEQHGQWDVMAVGPIVVAIRLMA